MKLIDEIPEGAQKLEGWCDIALLNFMTSDEVLEFFLEDEDG
jgi:hypothetical protein